MKLVKDNWQNNELDKILSFLKKLPDIKIIILKGSLVGGTIDYWSDIDLVLVLKNNKIEKFSSNLDWLNFYKNTFACSILNKESLTLRIVFDDFTRIDFSIIEEGNFIKNFDLRDKLLTKTFKVAYSNSSYNIEIIKPKILVSKYLLDPFLIEDFWFKACLCITKLMRNDLLISYHLFLDLVRDYLVILMISRDREANNNHHRYGIDKFNKYINKIDMKITLNKFDFIYCIDHIVKEFNHLTKKEENYKTRYPYFKKFLDKAIVDLKN